MRVLPQGTAPRSLCLWAKSDDAAKDDNADHTVNWGTYSDGMGFGVMIFEGNTWYAYGHGSANDLNFGVAVTTNWQFLVCTYDGSILKIYVDGVLRNSRVSSLNTQGTDLIIGENLPPIQSWNSFDGCLDDIRIYNRALISAEVLELYAETSLPVSICLFEAEREPGVTHSAGMAKMPMIRFYLLVVILSSSKPISSAALKNYCCYIRSGRLVVMWFIYWV